METAVESVNDTAVIRIEGDLTAAGAETLEATFAAATSAGAARILVAFRDADHINSAGIGILIGLVMECRKRNLAMGLAHPSAHFRRIFDIVGLSRYVDVHVSVDEALAFSS